MSIAYPIFPGLAPGQSMTKPTTPIRAPKWNYKLEPKWNNKRQQSMNGRVLVVKYWINPLWSWEWTYGYILDDPSGRSYNLGRNNFFTAPLPATDFEILKSFFCGMQGQGNEFAYQPPNSVRGGSFNITSVVVLTNGVAILGTDGATPLTQLQLGDGLNCSGLSTATYLNGENGTVIAIDSVLDLITLQIPTSGTHALVTDSGTAVGGQPLAAADSNDNSELRQTIGSYPTTIAAVPTMQPVTEALQLIDTSTLTIYANGSSVAYALNNPDTVASYQGYVAHFASPPATPITASYHWFYPCRFSEDTQQYENFLAMLYACSSLKFDQIRI